MLVADLSTQSSIWTLKESSEEALGLLQALAQAGLFPTKKKKKNNGTLSLFTLFKAPTFL